MAPYLAGYCCPYCSARTLIGTGQLSLDGKPYWQCDSCAQVLGVRRNAFLTILYLMTGLAIFCGSASVLIFTRPWEMMSRPRKSGDFKAGLAFFSLEVIGIGIGMWITGAIARDSLRKKLKPTGPRVAREPDKSETAPKTVRPAAEGVSPPVKWEAPFAVILGGMLGMGWFGLPEFIADLNKPGTEAASHPWWVWLSVFFLALLTQALAARTWLSRYRLRIDQQQNPLLGFVWWHASWLWILGTSPAAVTYCAGLNLGGGFAIWLAIAAFGGGLTGSAILKTLSRFEGKDPVVVVSSLSHSWREWGLICAGVAFFLGATSRVLALVTSMPDTTLDRKFGWGCLGISVVLLVVSLAGKRYLEVVGQAMLRRKS